MAAHRILMHNSISCGVLRKYFRSGYCLSSSYPRLSTATDDGWKTHYAILGVKSNATRTEIREAYLILSKQHHPDMKGAVDAEMFQKIQEAYEVLSNNRKRQEYDHNQMRRRDPAIPVYESEFSKYYHDGTFYQGDKTPMKQRFSNLQIAALVIVFGFIGGFIQLLLYRKRAQKKEKRLDEIHQDSLKHLTNIKTQSAQLQEELKRVAESRLKRAHGTVAIQQHLNDRNVKLHQEQTLESNGLETEIIDNAKTG